LGGFIALQSLWDAEAAPLFPSESSARWFIRTHREALVDAQAIAIHTGRTLIHLERFEAVVQRVALQLASSTLTRSVHVG
jgi:hypothetical protein